MAVKRALVVDDSKSARVVLSRMLEKYGIDVDSAESAESAL
jgi:CheY-like chemotaxis protein